MRGIFKLLLFFVMTSQAWAQGFEPGNAFDWNQRVTFAEPFDCDASFVSHTRCVISQPKELTLQEKEILKSLFQRLPEESLTLFEQIFKRDDDKITIFRHRSGWESIGPNRFKRNNLVTAIVDRGRKNTIHVFDLFFEITKPINETYNHQDYTLFHEIVHIYDRNNKNVSETAEFLSLYGWERVPTGETYSLGGFLQPVLRWQTADLTFQELDAIRLEINELYLSGDKAGATNRNLGVGLQYGHPTSYSMTNPHENLAELVTHYFLDPPSLRTAPDQVMEWLSERF